MKAEIIIDKIGEILKMFKFAKANEESKMKALNIANAILYPLKENKTIEDYQFLAKTDETSIYLSIMVKEPTEPEASYWDLVLTTQS